jgi:hypothetical protein
MQQQQKQGHEQKKHNARQPLTRIATAHAQRESKNAATARITAIRIGARHAVSHFFFD